MDEYEGIRATHLSDERLQAAIRLAAAARAAGRGHAEVEADLAALGGMGWAEAEDGAHIAFHLPPDEDPDDASVERLLAEAIEARRERHRFVVPDAIIEAAYRLNELDDAFRDRWNAIMAAQPGARLEALMTAAVDALENDAELHQMEAERQSIWASLEDTR